MGEEEVWENELYLGIEKSVGVTFGGDVCVKERK